MDSKSKAGQPKGNPSSEKVSSPEEPFSVEGLSETREDAPRSLLNAPKKEPEKFNRTAVPAPDSLTDMVYGTISLGHDLAAIRTKWDGWKLTPEEAAHYKRALKFMLRNADPKDWPEIFAGFTMIMIEGGKIAGYMSWRNDSGNPINLSELFNRGKREKHEDKPVTESDIPLGVMR